MHGDEISQRLPRCTPGAIEAQSEETGEQNLSSLFWVGDLVSEKNGTYSSCLTGN